MRRRSRSFRRRIWGSTLLLAAGASGAAAAAGSFPPFVRGEEAESPPSEMGQHIENVPYDGRFSLARIRFGSDDLGRGFFGRGREPPWAHDFPRAERNLMRIVRELSHIDPSRDGGNVFDGDDPELFRFPVAYLVEPGHWRPSESEAEALREYLLKGGFLIVDDFRGREWLNFERQMDRVLPGYDFVELDLAAPIFHAFFAMDALDFPHPYTRRSEPTYFALHEENDPTRRVMVVVNFDQDIGDYWEFSDLGRYPVGSTNEAFKLGVNYLIYGMTH